VSSASDRANVILALLEEGGGAIRFDRYISAALHHPEVGYYAATIQTIGKGGDFTTWPQLDKSLSRAVAGWAKTFRPDRGKWQLVEAGAGSGILARDTLRALGWWQKPEFTIIEHSRHLRERQKQNLPRGCRWVTDPSELGSGKPTLIYSNELIDAFPCRVFERSLHDWLELHFTISGGRGTGSWQPAKDLPISSVFDHDWPEGQRLEVHEAFSSWLKVLAANRSIDRLLFIDYGDRSPDLYKRQPKGSLRGYLRQQKLQEGELFKNFGRIDLTADVNFTDIERIVRSSGFTDISLMPLRDFIKKHTSTAPSDQQLLAAGGAGESFLVLDAGRQTA